jgi:uncharacterized membrane protein YkvA (DUF1232 family)
MMKRLFRRIGNELGYYRALMSHPRTPRLAKWLIGLAVAYFVSPIDLIPDAIPVLGQLDDLLIVPGLIYLALRMIPAEVKSECRARPA